MAATFNPPRVNLWTNAGAIAPLGTVRFFAATTTTPLAVYSNAALSVAIAQPIQADSAGRLPQIYLPTGAYKVVYYSDAAGTVVVTTDDNCDTGIPAGSGALAVANGGTGATTAAAARTNLGAAAQTGQDTLATSVAAIEAQITGVGGTLKALAGRDDITRSQLAASFGVVCLKRSLLASTSAWSNITAVTPYDNTIPQISEGAELLTGAYTPISATSEIEIEVNIQVTGVSFVCVALFQSTAAPALAARWSNTNNLSGQITFRHRMASVGTSAITFSVRVGVDGSDVDINGASGGTRVGGGVQLSYMHVSEWLTV